MFNLIPYLSVVENVTLPCQFSLHRREKAAARSSSFKAEAMRLLKSLGLDGASVIKKPANELSVGQQQRVAIARALVTSPSLLLADEPTGNLDSRTTRDVMALFQELNDQGVTIVIVTHEDEVSAFCKRSVVLRDGRIVQDRSQQRISAQPAGAP